MLASSFFATISIHAPRVGSDTLNASKNGTNRYFNPRSPCGERPAKATIAPAAKQFQSTLPVWGATSPCSGIPPQSKFQSTLPVWGATLWDLVIVRKDFISIHAPRVGSDVKVAERYTKANISIHAPRVGSDQPIFEAIYYHCKFQSTLPVWGATVTSSILQGSSINFNPRSPCGERLLESAISANTMIFQSTLPVWGATKTGKHMISLEIFQSTLPVWGATKPGTVCREWQTISIHAPRVGSDRTICPL